MKKVYKAPSILVEDARLSAFCSGGCTDSQKYQDFIDWITTSFASDGQCYCYHGSMDIESIAEGFGFVNMDS